MTLARFRSLFALASFILISAISSVVFAGYEAPNPAYDAPASYYNAATGTGTTLRMNLHTIISTGFVGRTYGQIRFDFANLDADPNNPGNIRLVYNDQSVSGVWDSGVTFSREHQIPVSWLGTGDPGNNDAPSAETDYFELRPINPGVNSSRGNTAYGSPTANGLNGPTAGGFYYAGNTDSGEVARAMFYMATRYYTGSPTLSINNLALIAGQPANGSFQIGDLPSLLKNNYERGVDNFERRRNNLIYTDYQDNRNPFVDHPEYVWAVFGGGNNDAQIHIGTAASDGSSSLNNTQRCIKGSSLSPVPFTLSKDGADPTTYDLTATGSVAVTDVSGSALGTGQPFDYGTVTRALSANFAPDTSTTGLKTATITVHDTDLTTSGAGHGSGDGNDQVNLSAVVVDHSKASFASGSSAVTATSINFGTIPANSGVVTLPFDIFDLGTDPSFTATLDIDSINGTGSTSVLGTNVGTTTIAGGSSGSFQATLDTSSMGTFSADYTIGTSDENIAGGYAPGSQPITIHITGTVGVPEPMSFSILAIGGMGLLARRRRA